MKSRVVITGVGAVTPVGNTAQKSWHNVIKGISGTGRLTQIPQEIASHFKSQVAAEVSDFDAPKYVPLKQIKKTDRFVQLALAATRMALDDSKLDLTKENPSEIGVLVGSGIGGLRTIEEQHKILLEKGPERISPFLIPMLIVNMAPGQISIQYGFKGPNNCVATACATGSHAIGDAFKIIQRGEATIMVAAMKALSTYNDDPKTASRPFDATRNGFVMGEGCGVVILEELEHALQRNAHIFAEIIGYGMTSDATHMTAPDPAGDGASRCMIRAMKEACVKPEQVDYINAHGTSTPLNDKTETAVIKQVFGKRAHQIPISATKSMIGHLIGAAGSVELVATLLAMENRLIPPTINYETQDPECDLDYVPNKARSANIRIAMKNSFGFGGKNSILIVGKVDG